MKLKHIRKQLPLDAVPNDPAQADTSSPTTDRPNGDAVKTSSYLGNASDIHFFNTIRDLMREQEVSSTGEENDAQSYDQSDLSELAPALGTPLRFLTRETALSYLDIYFSTIHIAYPFLSKPTVYHHFERIWIGELNKPDDRPWLALLSKYIYSEKPFWTLHSTTDTIFAIGAYYTSFPLNERQETSLHIQYFEQALLFSNHFRANSTLTTVWLLLTQCFFLLAICETDR